MEREQRQRTGTEGVIVTRGYTRTNFSADVWLDGLSWLSRSELDVVQITSAFLGGLIESRMTRVCLRTLGLVSWCTDGVRPEYCRFYVDTGNVMPLMTTTDIRTSRPYRVHSVKDGQGMDQLQECATALCNLIRSSYIKDKLTFRLDHPHALSLIQNTLPTLNVNSLSLQSAESFTDLSVFAKFIGAFGGLQRVEFAATGVGKFITAEALRALAVKKPKFVRMADGTRRWDQMGHQGSVPHLSTECILDFVCATQAHVVELCPVRVDSDLFATIVQVCEEGRLPKVFSLRIGPAYMSPQRSANPSLARGGVDYDEAAVFCLQMRVEGGSLEVKSG